MAKKQTFTSKLSKQGSNFKHIKHIKSVVSEDTGHIFRRSFPPNVVSKLRNNSNLLLIFLTFFLFCVKINR
jgi:hypothetical protein